MSDTFRVTLAQVNPTVGDLAANAEMIRQAQSAAQDARSDMVAFPEMVLTGYTAQDLVMKPAFVRDAMALVESLARETVNGPAMAIGAPFMENNRLYNGYHICRGGVVSARVFKHYLPNYSVFDEVRQFNRGPLQGPYDMGVLRIGSPICEDAWYSDPAEAACESGADMLIVPNGSPYARNKFERRMNVAVARVIENNVPLVYVNMVGGQDELVYDGGSFVLNPGGHLAVQLPLFEETLAHVDFKRTQSGGWEAVTGPRAVMADNYEQDYQAMVVGLRDYVRKSGFDKVMLGLSGGIDSALVAAIAVDALGADKVSSYMLPSRYTSQSSLDDAAEVAKRLGISCETLSISGAQDAVTDTLAPLFNGYAPDLTEENLQSRLRGVLLMALSNKFGAMLLTTGNKSEVAVGYATIYGDMNGGYNPIKDLYKTRVFETCRRRNTFWHNWMRGPQGEVIPHSIIEKPPSAELRPDQRDDQSLPPYDVLDSVLDLLVEQDASVADCIAAGHDPNVIQLVQRLLYNSEYKRFQSAPGPRLSQRSFGLSRRYPIVNRWRDK